VLVQVQSRAPLKSLPSGSYFNSIFRATDSEPQRIYRRAAPGPVALKESLGEYGSGWGWEGRKYAHVFDQTDSDGKIKRYYSNGTNESVCDGEVDITDGQVLGSRSQMLDQMSCIPDTGNAGNYYNFGAATAGGGRNAADYAEPNSACPKGWKLNVNDGLEVESWYYLIRNTYSILSGGDKNLRLLPMSFIRSGIYNFMDCNSTFCQRSTNGNYWSATNRYGGYIYLMTFTSGSIVPQQAYNGYNPADGVAIRCVAR